MGLGWRTPLCGESHNEWYRSILGCRSEDVCEGAIMIEREAASLRELMIIRDQNRDRIEAVNQNLGSALGWKHTNGVRTNHPAVIVFVPDKLHEALVPRHQQVPARLKATFPAGGTIFCETDVVRGGKNRTEQGPFLLSMENQAVVDELCRGRIGLVGGVQLGGFHPILGPYVGTAGCAVRDRQGRVGLLTSQHVAGSPGRLIYHPRPGQHSIGFCDRAFEHLIDHAHFGGIVDETNCFVRLNCAAVRLNASAAELARPGLHELGELGEVLPIDIDSMDIIGTEVTSIGRTRGIQKGEIVAYAYEFIDDEGLSICTDLLIIGCGSGVEFSNVGDCGKLIVAQKGSRPVGLSWGGWRARLREGYEQENWAYATDLAKVLRYLDIEILRD